MRSKQLILGQYDTDKITNRYLERYDSILQPWVDKKITLLEIGIYRGGSLLLWRDYFSQGTIVGVDVALPKDFAPPDRIRVYEGSQADTRFLTEVADKVAPEGFDIIIDDASHNGELTKKAFWHLFDHHLKPGGLYVIEDWGTGYFEDWPDGMRVKRRRHWLLRLWTQLLSRLRRLRHIHLKIPFYSHNYGMVGFIKEIVDEQGAADVTKAHSRGKPERNSKFESILITPYIVFVKKAADQP